MKEFGCPADQHDLTMKIFVSPEMLSKPVPHTLGGKKSSFPWLCLSWEGSTGSRPHHICDLHAVTFHLDCAPAALAIVGIIYPRAGMYTPLGPTAELSLRTKSLLCACLCREPTPLSPASPGPWGPGAWWWTSAEPTSPQWLKHHTEMLEKKWRAALQTCQMAAKCKSNGCRWWAWGWKVEKWWLQRKSGFEPVTMEQYHSIRITAVGHWSLLVSPKRNKWFFLKLQRKKKMKESKTSSTIKAKLGVTGPHFPPSCFHTRASLKLEETREFLRVRKRDRIGTHLRRENINVKRASGE